MFKFVMTTFLVFAITPSILVAFSGSHWINWRWVEIVCILLGSIAILSAGLHLSRWVAENHLPFSSRRARNHLDIFIDIIGFNRREIDGHLEYLMLAPGNDQEKEEYKNAVVYVQKLHSEASSVTNEEYLAFRPIEIIKAFNPQSPSLVRMKTNILSLGQTYEEVARKFEEHRSGSKPGMFEEALLVMSPVLFSIATGLALAKAWYQ